MGSYGKIELPDDLPGDVGKEIQSPKPETLRIYAPAEAMRRIRRKLGREDVKTVYGPPEKFFQTSNIGCRPDDDVVEIYGPAEMLGALGGNGDSEELDAPLPPDEEEEPAPPPVYGPAEWFEIPADMPSLAKGNASMVVYGPAEPGPVENAPSGTATPSPLSEPEN